MEELVRSMGPDQLRALAAAANIGPQFGGQPDDRIWILREEIRKDAAGIAADRLRAGPVLEGWHWVVTHWAVEDETSSATSVRVGINSGDRDLWLAEQVTVVGGVLYHDTTVQIVTHNEEFVAQFVSPTAADKLVLFLHGFMLPPGTPVTPGLLLALAFPQRRL